MTTHLLTLCIQDIIMVKDDINHSSGDKGTDPVFVYNYLSSEDCSNIIGQGQCLFNNRLFLVQSSNSLLPLFDTDKSTSTFTNM